MACVVVLAREALSAGASACSGSPGSRQYCDLGAAFIACDTVLVVCAEFYPHWCADVQSTLLSTAAFATVDVFDAHSGTPTSAQLMAYHAVIVHSDWHLFGDPVLLGDRLAAYHDQGGGGRRCFMGQQQ
jgi:hypothetical protein